MLVVENNNSARQMRDLVNNAVTYSPPASPQHKFSHIHVYACNVDDAEQYQMRFNSANMAT